MSLIVPIASIPNQSFSFQPEEVRYDIRLADTGSMMILDLSINEVVVLSGSRITGGAPLIPYQYLENGGGNFLFLTELGDIPYWDQFGITQSLMYVTVSELEAIRAGS